MSSTISLSALPVGRTAILRQYPKAGNAFLRLRELGLLPGVAVTLVRTAPLGDPLEIRVRGCSLTLRKSEAEHLLVEPQQPPGA
jgi:ferrous iron transport protein A